MTNPNDVYTVASLFNRAINIEYTICNLYHKLSKLFSHVSKISTFWEQLIDDEKTHAKTLKEILNSLTDEQLTAPPNKQIWEHANKIETSLKKDIIGEIKNLDDAYELAHELEHSEINSIFKFLTMDLIHSDKRKRMISSEIRNHQQKLSHFSKNFGDKTWREEIKIQQ